MKLAFVTGNKGKLAEARVALEPLGIEVEMRDLKPMEIQGDSLEQISLEKARAIRHLIDVPYIVDDGGLFVDALKGFPGVFSAHALKTIGFPGILRLMEGERERAAHFAAVVTYHDGKDFHQFPGRCDGRIGFAPKAKGHGFGFDPIFHATGHDETFAEMSAEAKNALSHRGKALAALVRHLAER